MINPKVRFSLDDNGSIFCYATSQSLAPNGVYATENGTCYDMEVLSHLLRSGQYIDDAVVGRVTGTGECHWVFEGEVMNEISTQKANGEELPADTVELRETCTKLTDKLNEATTTLESAHAALEVVTKQRDDLRAQLEDRERAAVNRPIEPGEDSKPIESEIKDAIAETMAPQDVTPEGEEASS